MSYIGATPTSTAFLTDSFSGDGSTTSFTLSAAPASSSSILVAVSGVLQDPATYAVVGTALNFTGAPPSGTANISVRYLGIPASNISTAAYRTVTEFTATAGQTSFSTPSYTVGFINVYRNGVLLGSADYTATTGTTVVLASGATAGDLITTESFYVSSIYNAISNTAGSVNSNNIADGAVTPSELSTGGPYWDTSGRVGINTTDTSSFGRRLIVNGTGGFNNDSGTVGVGFSRGSANTYGYIGTGDWAVNGLSTADFGISSGASGVLAFGTGSGTERMRIDSSGRVTTPYQPTFHATCNSVTQLSGSTLLFQDVKVNIGSCYNSSTARFTAPIAGTYFFYGSVMANSGTGRLFWRMYKNGSNVQYMQAGGASTDYGSWYGAMTITLAANDYITCDLSGGTPYSGNQFEQYFGGYLLG